NCHPPEPVGVNFYKLIPIRIANFLMVKVPIFVKLPTPRLLYTLNWLFQERLGIDYQILTNRTEALAQQFCIGYGESLGNGISIPDTGLLRQTNISEIALGNGTWETLPVLFHQNDSKWS